MTIDVIHMMMMMMMMTVIIKVMMMKIMMIKIIIDDNNANDVNCISPNKTDNTAFFVFRNQKLVKSCDLFE